MINIPQLRAFLVKAKKTTYASGNETNQSATNDGSTTLIYAEGDWMYHDNYFGGEPYGGREIVSYKNKPVYIMVYYGCAQEDISDLKHIYTFLQHALTVIPENHPYRGPQTYNENNLSYTNNFTGEIDNFSGEEIITQDGEEIYRAKYIGGLVDQRT